MPLTDLCAECRNYFTQDSDKHKGTFTVKDGALAPLDFLAEGQYFRILGSVFNDGVHQYPDVNLTDEVFDGEIWAMRVPPAFLSLSQEIDDWLTKNGEASRTPYQQESFGGYSYMISGGGTLESMPSAYKAYWNELRRWRKL